MTSNPKRKVKKRSEKREIFESLIMKDPYMKGKEILENKGIASVVQKKSKAYFRIRAKGGQKKIK
jgi:hypothetical protein